MTTTLATATPVSVESAVEQALVMGDLSRLTPDQRVNYYHATCKSLGLNPLTKPFDYISLNGKLTLYAKRDCTDQLRSIHKISIRIVSRERSEDVYVVTARATMPDGREDESTGVVTLTNLRGENLANALMKAETKAKRRATLSIVGLGLLDETELETVRDARTVVEPGPDSSGELNAVSVFLARIEAATTVEELGRVAADVGKVSRSLSRVERDRVIAAGKARKVALGEPPSSPNVTEAAE